MKKTKSNPAREVFNRDYMRMTPFPMNDTPEERLKCEYTKQKIAEINGRVRAENERAKKEHKLLRPYWANFFPEGQGFQEVCVFPDLCDIDQLGYKPKSMEGNNHPLLSKYGKGGTLALGAMAANDEQYLEWSFSKIDSFFNEEMNRGNPKTAKDLTPNQVAILELEEQLAFLQFALAQDGNNYRHIAEAISFGAALMRLAIDNPGSELAAKLDKLLSMDFSKAAARGMEQVIRKREKKRQDARKSAADAKRKTSAIAKMKKLVPQYGQVKASEIVEHRINKRHYESMGAIQKVLPVTPGTVKRWYNAKLAEENEARNEAAKRRLGRIPT